MSSTFPLSNLTNEHGKHLVDEESGQEVFHATTPHSLIQGAGYLKHTRAKRHRKGVFFRGQTKLHPTLQPSLLRGVKDGPANVARRKLLDHFLDDIGAQKKALRAVDADCREALLQHYGIRTTWIDVVDNIWVALWFSCHEALVAGKVKEYLHFEKRIQIEPTSKYAYILLLESAYFDPVSGRPGHYRDEKTETIDLRISAPSHFVRPHAQHGILVRKLSKTGLPVSDCSTMHVGTIRVNLLAAMDWLGTASTLTTHSLFPPAFYDYGYRELVDHIHPRDRLLGAIHRVQA